MIIRRSVRGEDVDWTGGSCNCISPSSKNFVASGLEYRGTLASRQDGDTSSLSLHLYCVYSHEPVVLVLPS